MQQGLVVTSPNTTAGGLDTLSIYFSWSGTQLVEDISLRPICAHPSRCRSTADHLKSGRSFSRRHVQCRSGSRVSRLVNFGRRRMAMGHSTFDPVDAGPAWNAGRKLGAKRPLKPREIWAIRFMLDQARKVRDRALFDLAIDSKLRGCDLVKVKTGDLVAGGRVRNRAMVIQQKTKRPVQFELLEPARSTILAWLERRGGGLDDFAFPSRFDHANHLSARQYARLVDEWVRHWASTRRLRHALPAPDEGRAD